jgi:membrane protease YdiL (CAAX protease family)
MANKEMAVFNYLMVVFLYQLMLIAIVSIITFAFMTKNRENYVKIGIFSICFIFYFLMRILPGIVNFQNFNLPWESRLLSIAAGIICFFLFRKHFINYNYFKIKYDKSNFKVTLIVSLATIIGYLIVFYFRGQPQIFNTELFLFISMVSVEEEIIFRGLILGILMSCLDKKVLFIKYPGAVLCGILFGFWHGTFFNFDLLNIIVNCFYGYIMGWLTIKHKSIVVPIIVHILTNVSGYFLQVIVLK